VKHRTRSAKFLAFSQFFEAQDELRGIPFVFFIVLKHRTRSTELLAFDAIAPGRTLFDLMFVLAVTRSAEFLAFSS